MKNNFIIYLVVLAPFILSAQDSLSIERDYERLSIGLGVGHQTAIVGFKSMYYPREDIGIFAGIGGARGIVGFTGGVRYRFIQHELKNRFTPFAYASYGTNVFYVLRLPDASLSTLYYGFSYGIGLDWNWRIWAKRTIVSISLGSRINDSSLQDYITEQEEKFKLDFKDYTRPVQLSLSWNIALF